MNYNPTPRVMELHESAQSSSMIIILISVLSLGDLPLGASS